MIENVESQKISTHTKALTAILCAICLLCGLGIFALFHLNTPPEDFPLEKRISIPSGATLSTISFELKNQKIIHSGLAFRIVMLWYGKESTIPAGEYLFHEKLSLLEVARSFITQTVLIPPAKVTIPEGATLAEFDARISAALPHVEPGDIIRSAHEKEGVLFPDTYLLQQSWSGDQVVALLSDTFRQKMAPFENDFAHETLTKEQIIVLASILEKEANDGTSMHMVSGILRKRLAMHMPLQVDATFRYLLNKTSAELTPEDLAIDSPFNTYTHKGLPPGPIASPGVLAIEAALHPQASPYLYYLTDAEGVFHYAATFDEHKKNKARYLHASI